MSHKCQGLHRSTRRCRKWFLIDSRSRKLSSDVVMPNLASFAVPVHIARCEKVTSFLSITTATPHQNILLIFWSWLTVWDHRLLERGLKWKRDKYWSNNLHGKAFKCRCPRWLRSHNWSRSTNLSTLRRIAAAGVMTLRSVTQDRHKSLSLRKIYCPSTRKILLYLHATIWSIRFSMDVKCSFSLKAYFIELAHPLIMQVGNHVAISIFRDSDRHSNTFVTFSS